MNEIFNICMNSLVWVSNLIGITYEEINVITFCIVWPLLTIFLIYKAYIKKWKTINYI